MASHRRSILCTTTAIAVVILSAYGVSAGPNSPNMPNISLPNISPPQLDLSMRAPNGWRDNDGARSRATINSRDEQATKKKKKNVAKKSPPNTASGGSAVGAAAGGAAANANPGGGGSANPGTGNADPPISSGLRRAIEAGRLGTFDPNNPDPNATPVKALPGGPQRPGNDVPLLGSDPRNPSQGNPDLRSPKTGLGVRGPSGQASDDYSYTDPDGSTHSAFQWTDHDGTVHTTVFNYQPDGTPDGAYYVEQHPDGRESVLHVDAEGRRSMTLPTETIRVDTSPHGGATGGAAGGDVGGNSGGGSAGGGGSPDKLADPDGTPAGTYSGPMPRFGPALSTGGPLAAKPWISGGRGDPGRTGPDGQPIGNVDIGTHFGPGPGTVTDPTPAQSSDGGSGSGGGSGGSGPPPRRHGTGTDVGWSGSAPGGLTGPGGSPVTPSLPGGPVVPGAGGGIGGGTGNPPR